MWSSIGVALLAGLYVSTGIIGVVMRPPGSDLLRQVEPYLTIMEVLMALAAALLVVVMAAVHNWAPADGKTSSLAALAFTTIFAGVTCSTHFVSLTVGRHIDSKAAPLLLRHISFGEWPNVALALDLLAWDVFPGLSLLFAATVFRGGLAPASCSSGYDCRRDSLPDGDAWARVG